MSQYLNTCLTNHTRYLFLNIPRIWATTRHDCNHCILTLLYWKSYGVYKPSVHFRTYWFRLHKADSLFPNNVSSTAVQDLIRHKYKGESRSFTKHITAEVTSWTPIRKVKIRQSLFNPFALQMNIYSLAHHLCTMWIFYEPRRVTLGNTRHFVGE